MLLFRNNAHSSLAAALSDVATTLTVATGHGDRFPAVTTPDFALITLEDAANNIEVVRVTHRTAGGDTMTIVRAQEGTTARNWAADSIVEQRLTAAGLGPLSVMRQAATAAAVRAEIDAPSRTGADASGTWGISITGNAATATVLQTARTINGVSFNGSADITLPTVNTAGDQSVGGVKTFTSQIVASGGVQGNVTGNVTGNAGTVTNGVYTTGDQTIDGVKDFTRDIITRAGRYTMSNSSVAMYEMHLVGQAASAWRLQSNGTVDLVTTHGNGVAVGTQLSVTNAGHLTTTGNITAGGQFIGNVTGNAGTVTNGVYTTGDQTIGGVKTFSSFPVLPATLGGFYKADATTVAFTKTAAGAVSIKAGTRVDVGGRWIEFASATPVTMPTLTAGEDYAIWCTPAGALQATADPFSSPAAPPVAGARKIGGFHYGLVAPGTTPAGGSFATTGFTNQGGSMIWTQAAVDRIAGINEFSIWDLAWRCKGQQRGMVLDPQTEVWHAIYFCSTNHIQNGISRFNTDVASGTVLPRIPTAYGGDGTLNYGRLSQYECEEIAASFGLRLPNVDEFRSAMFGVTEAQSLGGAAATIPLTARQPGYTSRLGIEQATGHQWIFARGNSAAGGSAWIAGPNRGNAFGNQWTVLLGCARDGAANSGSRASISSLVAWDSGWSIAFRAAGDHLKHG